MRKISVLVPCYNEKDNVSSISEAILNELSKLKKYDYELVFIDNDSKDGTREIIRSLCHKNHRIKAIFNVKNFGQFNSPYYGLCQLDGDCVILMCADFQDPIELIPTFVKYWEDGYEVVCGIKTSSRENKLMYYLRSIYYKLIKKFSNVEQIEHFTGFGLYDRKFLNILRELNDPTPFLRGIVAEYCGKRKDVEYEQQKRKSGKTHNNWYSLYDAAMLSFTSYTKIGMRLAVFMGLLSSLLSIVIGFIYLIKKLVHWYDFYAGQTPTILMITFFSSIILLFMGIMGEYILSINERVIHRPLVIEQERLNFKTNNKK